MQPQTKKQHVQNKVDLILGLLSSSGRQVNSAFRGKLEKFLKAAVSSSVDQAADISGTPPLGECACCEACLLSMARSQAPSESESLHPQAL